MSATHSDILVVGGGLVGLAAARALAAAGAGTVSLLEAEADVARHQSGRNSGVVHAGLYYRPDSHKARLCAEGREELVVFCAERNVPFRRCGKLVLAVEERELPALEALARRASANGLEGVERLDPAGVREREPATRGVAGLWVPQTGVVDFRHVAGELAKDLAGTGVAVHLRSRVLRVTRTRGELRLQTPTGSHACRLLVNCAGLQCDRVARLCGLEPDIRIVPFRGEYYELVPEKRHLVRGLVYPVPDAGLPFLGVHLTRTIDDRVEAGPNAVLAFAREGYGRLSLSPRDIASTLAFGGFWKLARRHWRSGLAEQWRSVSRRSFVGALRRLVPELSTADVRRGGAGIRAQAVGPSGRLLDDFHILREEGMVHVLNAPSPAATAALAIGRHIARLALEVG